MPLLMTDNIHKFQTRSYAVKRLHHNDRKAYEVELAALKKFSGRNHVHLTNLLVTYIWRGRYHLLFPWADGNLLNFWQRNPQPSDPVRGYELSRWMSGEILGIVEGLRMIHTLDFPANSDPAQNGLSAQQTHGRHGDLKPENILWFKPEEPHQDHDIGLLKISDFGLTRFNRTASANNVYAKRLAVSPTYRAPEYDVAETISQNYDIWSLGCVLLEFVTWYLLGGEEVDSFAKRRAVDDKSEIKEDVFFNYFDIRGVGDGGENKFGARAKRSVYDVSFFRHMYLRSVC